jgi:hypothetical protein
MNERDERLRELLRAADAAAEAPELGEGEVAWMRQRVLRAASEVPPRKRAARAWVLAGATALLALAIGLALTRMPDTRDASPARGGAPSRAEVSTPQLPPSRPASGDVQAASPSSAKRPNSSAPARPRAAAESAERAPTQLASRGSDGDNGAARVRTDSRAARPARSHTNAGESAPPEVTIAQAAPERQPYQLQLTAPGGTKIVWVLTADNGG